jgi:hypothetical protein
MTNEKNESYESIYLNESNISQCKKCNINIDDKNKELDPIMNPEYNMREASKQCILLEDHINNKSKRCEDCIKKHFLIVDGLIEEAISLEQNAIEREKYRKYHSEWINIEKRYVEIAKKKMNKIDELSMEIRQFRKPLVIKYFDTVSSYK